MSEENRLVFEEYFLRLSELTERLDRSTITDEQLKKLTGKLQDLFRPPLNDWHSWFLAALNVSFRPVHADITIEAEHILGVMPPRADYLIISKKENLKMPLEIFRFFRKDNIVEYKNPDDIIDERTLRKLIGYGNLYISQKNDSGSVKSSDVTLSLFRNTKPYKLFKALKSYIAKGPVKGIYYVSGMSDLPMQIIVTRELEGDDYALFRTISRHPNISDVQIIKERALKETDYFMEEQYEALLTKTLQAASYCKDIIQGDLNMEQEYIVIYKDHMRRTVEEAVMAAKAEAQKEIQEKDAALREARAEKDEALKEARAEKDEALKEARAEKDEQMLRSITSIMNSLGYTAKQAMDVLRLSEDEQAFYSKKLA